MEKKLTKRELFVRVLAKIGNDPELVSFIKKEVELLDKREGSKKPTSTQKENVALKQTIFKCFMSDPNLNATISDLQSIFKECLGSYSNQKLNSLIRQLVAEGKVAREEIKRKAYFSLNPALAVLEEEAPEEEVETTDLLDEPETEEEEEDPDPSN